MKTVLIATPIALVGLVTVIGWWTYDTIVKRLTEEVPYHGRPG